jgi:hypothetical protein
MRVDPSHALAHSHKRSNFPDIPRRPRRDRLDATTDPTPDRLRLKKQPIDAVRRSPERPAGFPAFVIATNKRLEIYHVK